MPENPREQQLQIEVVEGRLVISIGVDLLIGSAIEVPAIDGGELVVTDADAFITAIVDELEAEEGDGTTLIHHALDKAANNAIDNGCEGVSDAPAEAEQEDD